MDKACILIVEDERIIALDLRSKVARLGYVVAGMAHTGQEAIRLANELSPDLVLMDIILDGGMDGIEAASHILKTRAIPVVFVSACNDQGTRDRAALLGCAGFVSKPVDSRELSARLTEALERAGGPD